MSAKRMLALVLALLSALFLVAGLTLPIVALERLFFFTDTPSILDVLAGLWASSEVALVLILSLVSVVLPLAKLAGIVLLLASARRMVWLGTLLTILGRYALVDVMVVALVIFAAKTSGLATAASQPGLWFYAGSGILAAASAALASTEPASRRH